MITITYIQHSNKQISLKYYFRFLSLLGPLFFYEKRQKKAHNKNCDIKLERISSKMSTDIQGSSIYTFHHVNNYIHSNLIETNASMLSGANAPYYSLWLIFFYFNCILTRYHFWGGSDHHLPCFSKECFCPKMLSCYVTMQRILISTNVVDSSWITKISLWEPESRPFHG